MEERDWALLLCEQTALEQIEKTNRYTERFGLVLSREDATYLQQERVKQLQEQQRVEFGETILSKLIDTFCDSPYISAGDYEETLQTLIQMFYDAKNEMQDRIGDDRLLTYMKTAFDGPCRGSLELLAGSVLPQAAAAIRAGRPLPAPEQLLNEHGLWMGEKEDV